MKLRRRLPIGGEAIHLGHDVWAFLAGGVEFRWIADLDSNRGSLCVPHQGGGMVLADCFTLEQAAPFALGWAMGVWLGSNATDRGPSEETMEASRRAINHTVRNGDPDSREWVRDHG